MLERRWSGEVRFLARAVERLKVVVSSKGGSKERVQLGSWLAGRRGASVLPMCGGGAKVGSASLPVRCFPASPYLVKCEANDGDDGETVVVVTTEARQSPHLYNRRSDTRG